MKKGILVVSFGTSFAETRKKTIEAIEDRIKENFKEYEVRRAFTSHIIIKKLKNRDNIIVDTPEEAMEKFAMEGFDEVVMQPLHLIPGLEYDYINTIKEKYEERFKSVKIGRPLLYYKCEEEGIDDYTIMAEAVKKQIYGGANVLLMGHGTPHYANAVYSCMEMVFHDCGMENVFMANVEGYPYISDALKKIKEKNAMEITLMPFMLVAGDHAQNDMAGDDEDSFKSILQAQGIKTKVYMHGLGENEEIQKIYIQHLKDAINDTYGELGKNKKGM